MEWKIGITEEAKRDYQKIDNSLHKRYKMAAKLYEKYGDALFKDIFDKF